MLTQIAVRVDSVESRKRVPSRSREKQARYARVTHCPLTCRSSTTSVTMSNVEQPDAKKRKVDDQHSSIAPVSGLLIKRLSEKAKLPTRGSALAAGYDLYRYSLVSTHQADAHFM
jgi:hypothetical protein